MPKTKSTTRKKRKVSKKNVGGNWRGIEDRFFNKVRKGFIKLMKSAKKDINNG